MVNQSARRLGPEQSETVEEEERDERHLRPEDPRSEEGLDVGREHREPADHDDDQSGDHPPVNGGELAQMLRTIGHGAANGPQRAAIRRDGEAAGKQQTADVEELNDGFSALGVTVVVVPGLEKLHDRFGKAHRDV